MTRYEYTEDTHGSLTTFRRPEAPAHVNYERFRDSGRVMTDIKRTLAYSRAQPPTGTLERGWGRDTKAPTASIVRTLIKIDTV